MRDIFPLPESRLEAVGYLAHLDQVIAAWRVEPGTGRAIRLLEGIRRAVEMTPWQL
jgi:hypothetical protein